MDKFTPIIFFTGLDRCGKSSTRKEFSLVTEQKYFTFDRSFVDNIVYGEIFRKIVLDEMTLESVMKRFSLLGNIYIVRLVLDFEEINKRAKETEGIGYSINELDECSKLFDKYLDIAQLYGIEVVTIDCNKKNIEKIVKEVVYKINNV